MIKNYFLRVFSVFLLIAGWTASSYADEWVPATKLDIDWAVSYTETGSGTVSTKDATVNLAANGGFFGALYKIEPTGIAGIAATVRVDQVSGNCALGLKATVGKIGNKRIQISISLGQYDQLNAVIGSKSIQYTVEMLDMETEKSNMIAAGVFGPWDGGWVIGEPILLGCARVGTELRFYTDGFKQLHKIDLMDEIVPLYGNVEVYAYASEGKNVSIAGSIYDILLYYP